MIRYDWLPYTKRRLGHRHLQKKDLLKAGRRKPSTNQGEKAPEKQHSDTLISDFLQNCENVNFCCLNHPVHGTFLCSPSKIIKIQLQILFTTSQSASCVKPVEEILSDFLSWESNYGLVLLFALAARKLAVKLEAIPNSHVKLCGLDFCVLFPILINDSYVYFLSFLFFLHISPVIRMD